MRRFSGVWCWVPISFEDNTHGQHIRTLKLNPAFAWSERFPSPTDRAHLLFVGIRKGLDQDQLIKEYESGASVRYFVALGQTELPVRGSQRHPALYWALARAKCAWSVAGEFRITGVGKADGVNLPLVVERAN